MLSGIGARHSPGTARSGEKPSPVCLIALLCTLPLAACAHPNATGGDSSSAATNAVARAAARRVVAGFGEQLKTVSTLAPSGMARRALRAHYGEFVTRALLRRWLSDPRNAPGREVSSPWPEGIRIRRVRCAAADRCEVGGTILYVTSNEVERGGVFATRPVRLGVRKTPKGWRIDAMRIGKRRPGS